MKKRTYKKATPRGFCFGVENALKILDNAIKKGTVYVRKEIVHNIVLVDYYKSLGVVFVDEVDDIPDGSTVVFSAHGVSPQVRKKSAQKALHIIDATCPLVEKVHEEAIHFSKQGYTIVLIGETGHDETIGIMGEAPDNIHLITNENDIDHLNINNPKIVWLSQTTLNYDDTLKIAEKLWQKYPSLQDPTHNICKATKERQAAVKSIAAGRGLFIVVGSKNSSNTNRLVEVAAGAAKTIRADRPQELNVIDFSEIKTIGITSGVSVTDELFSQFITYLEERGYIDEEV